jgi:hypothetical protein
MPKPLVQIDDEIREMTDEEYALYIAEIEKVKGNYPDVMEN